MVLKFTPTPVPALAAVPAGTALRCRLVVLDPSVTAVDQFIDVWPCPARSPAAVDPDDPYIRSSAFTAAAAIAAMPTLSPAQREARLNAVIELLAGLAPA